MPSTSAITLLPSAARTATGAGTPSDLTPKTSLDLALQVTALSADASLDVWLEHSANTVAWTPLGEHFLPVDRAGMTEQTFAGARRYVRARWSVTGPGTPSATFALTGDAVLVYATPSDLGIFGIPDARLDGVSDVKKDLYLRVATDEADGGLGEQYGLPLSKWGSDLRNAVCSIAAWMILTKVIGVNPEDNSDLEIKSNSDAAYKKLAAIARGDLSLVGVIDSTPEVAYDGGAVIYSDAPRGWDR